MVTSSSADRKAGLNGDVQPLQLEELMVVEREQEYLSPSNDENRSDRARSSQKRNDYGTGSDLGGNASQRVSKLRPVVRRSPTSRVFPYVPFAALLPALLLASAALFLSASEPTNLRNSRGFISKQGRHVITCAAKVPPRTGRRTFGVFGSITALLCLGKAGTAGASERRVSPDFFALTSDARNIGNGKTVFVAGSTGNTGKRTVDYLVNKYPSVKVLAGARNLEKAQKQGLTSLSGVEVRKFDMQMMSKEEMAKAISGADTVVCVTGFVPNNPLQMKKVAHEVDNEGTIRLIDAAKTAGVSKFVLISSILTNGRAIGQEKNPGFVITNAFGGVLDEKLVAEKYLRSSGLDYTIVRPGGLKDSPSTGGIIGTSEDRTFTGDISRDSVAEVLVEAAFDPKAANKVIEIIEGDGNAASADTLFSSVFS